MGKGESIPDSRFPQFVAWDDLALALSDGAPQRPRLKTVTVGAARDGVRAGMTLSEARGLCAKLEILPWDDVAIGDAITEVTASLVAASPQVSPVAGAPGMWWVGASGFAYGNGDEFALAESLRRITRRWHPGVRVAIAGSCVAARAATWSAPGRERGVTVIPAGTDAQYLRTAPLSLLPMDAEIRDALRALGIRNLGGFVDLDAGDVEQRWGDEGLAAWRLAQGDDPRRPVLARLDRQPHAELELGTPAATMEPVLFLLRPAVEGLVSQLSRDGRSVASFSITLTLDDARGALPNARAHTVTREIRLPRPLARPAPLLERCRGLLAQWPLTAPVSAVRVTILLTSPLSADQGNLLDTSWRDPGAADAALERVRAELGAGVVVTPHVRDGYTPERSGTWREEGNDALGGTRDRTAIGKSEGREPTTALRLLTAPERVDVDRDPEPRRIFWRGRALTIAHVVGPERLAGDWWQDGYTREYWRCESDEEAGELMLYRDAQGWWVQGWYD
jgi:protein ImuB